MTSWKYLFFALLLAGPAMGLTLHSEPRDDLRLDGIGSCIVNGRELYIGALYTAWPAHDPAALLSMPGRKRMALRVTADHWSATDFSRLWNRLLTVNNDGNALNANALDILAFTDFPGGALQRGDDLVVALTADGDTEVLLDGVRMLRSDGPALFNLLLNAWIGPHPVSPAFKQQLLTAVPNAAADRLLQHAAAVRAGTGRKQTIAAWSHSRDATAFVAQPAAAQTQPTRPQPPAHQASPAARRGQRPANRRAPHETATATAAQTPVATVARSLPGTAPPESAPPQSLPSKSAPTEPSPAAQTATRPTAAPAAQPAAVQPPAQPAPSPLRSRYLQQLRARIVRAVRYPKQAVRENIQGLVLVYLSLDKRGHPTAIDLRGGADPALKRAARQAVDRALPFPLPAGIGTAGIEARIPIVFQLRH